MKNRFDEIKKLYDQFRKGSTGVDPARDSLLALIISKCTGLLSDTDKVMLISKVPKKSYFEFNIPGTPKFSRAVNANLFSFEGNLLWSDFVASVRSGTLIPSQKEEISKILYSAAMSFCALNDLFSAGDQKTPGTFFEHFISYVFKLSLQVEPVTTILVLDYDGDYVKLQTDRIFNLGLHRPKFHVPIKTSSRERAIMLWAHQKLLDGVYGIEKFIGTPVLLAETKTDIKKKEVVEICLPDQWLVYQLYISKLKRVYYLDLPDAYLRLASATPPIHVKPLSEFFFEWRDIYY
ncbi:hypothetical protein [Dyadobacter sp. 32]|uniref:hypothetical protein n=1 Tax=Dyadobacter sp. 32 TaxID=538966 RepID=UPI0011EF115A